MGARLVGVLLRNAENAGGGRDGYAAQMVRLIYTSGV